MTESMEVTRDELYRQVWETPMQALAVRYGLSDVGLAKTCRRMRVPYPGRGHWAQMAARRVVHRPPLPNLSEDDRSTLRIVTFDPRRVERKRIIEAGDLAPYALFERAAENRILVPATLRGTTPVVRATIQALKASQPIDGLLSSRVNGTLRVTVSPELLNRAMRIADAIVRAFRSRGWVCAPANDDTYPSVRVLNQSVSFELRERKHRVPPKAKAPVRIGPGQYYTPSPSTEYRPSGRLALSILGLYGDGIRQSWVDGHQQSVEFLLNDFMLHIVLAANEYRARKRRQDEQEREWHQVRRAQMEEDRQRAELSTRISALQTHTANWVLSEQIKAFLTAARRTIDDQSRTGEFDRVQDNWLLWASEYAKTINPLERPLAELGVLPG